MHTFENLNYRPLSSCRKIMFSQACVIPSVQRVGGICLHGVCIQGGLPMGSASSAGGWGGQTPQSDTTGYGSTSRRYASYWNAFLFLVHTNSCPLSHFVGASWNSLCRTTCQLISILFYFGMGVGAWMDNRKFTLLCDWVFRWVVDWVLRSKDGWMVLDGWVTGHSDSFLCV